MVGVKGYLAIGAVVLSGAPAPGLAAAAETAPTMILISQGPAGGTDEALREHTRRTLDARLRALGAPMLSAAAPPTARDRAKIQLTALKRPAADPGGADLVIALVTESRLHEGAYTRRLRFSVRADLYPAAGGARRSVHAVRERRLRATCRAACTARLKKTLAGEAVKDLAPRIFKQARALVPVPARRIALFGFKPREIEEMRAYLRAFPGFVRMDRGRPRGGATIIRYASRLDRQRLEAALGKMLRHLDLAAGVRFKGRDVAVVRSASGRREGTSTRQW